MSTRSRTLAVGGVLLVVLVAGLLVGFLTLGSDGQSSGTTTTTPPITTSATPTDPRAQVEQAYMHAWNVWADALLKLDTTGLPEAFTGRALQLITAQVQEQRRSDEPVRVRAEHDYTVTILDATTASVDDQYINHNVRLDPKTLEPIEQDPSNPEHRSFTLRLVDGTWKIARIIEYQ
jgi:hypothetical protein